MRNKLGIIGIIAFLLSLTIASAALRGDFDGNGYIDGADAVYARSLSLGLNITCHDLSGQEFDCYSVDLYPDGKITPAEIALLQEIIVGTALRIDAVTGCAIYDIENITNVTNVTNICEKSWLDRYWIVPLLIFIIILFGLYYYLEVYKKR